MGILNFLQAAIRPKKAVAPYQVTSNIPPQENYAGYTNVPGLPQSPRGGDFQLDPLRLHAPFQIERNNGSRIDQTGIHYFDTANPDVVREPDQAYQQQFNQKKALDPIVPMVPGAGVFVPTAVYQRGWKQMFVASESMRALDIGISPPPRLSTPLRVTSITDGGRRAPISKARAHAPKRG